MTTNDRIIQIAKPYFNMKEVCRKSGVNYSTYKNYIRGVNNTKEENKEKIVNTIYNLYQNMLQLNKPDI